MGGPTALGVAKRLVYEVPKLEQEEAFAWTAEQSGRLFKGEECRRWNEGLSRAREAAVGSGVVSAAVARRGVSMFEQPQDFREESDALAHLLEPLADADFERETLFKKWSVHDVVAHLHLFNWAAELSLRDEEAFGQWWGEAMKQIRAGRSMRELADEWLEGKRGRAVFEQWRDFYPVMADGFAAADPKARVPWAGPSMSARSSVTARLMETWAHGQAVYDLLGVERVDSDRIKNIAVLGMNTFGWTFANRQLEVPEPVPNVRLRAPSGALWEWNPEVTSDRVEGSASEFCQVVTQVRNLRDTELDVTGPIAERWMSIAQCFAGPSRIRRLRARGAAARDSPLVEHETAPLPASLKPALWRSHGSRIRRQLRRIPRGGGRVLESQPPGRADRHRGHESKHRVEWLTKLIEHGYWGADDSEGIRRVRRRARPSEDRDHGRGVQQGRGSPRGTMAQGPSMLVPTLLAHGTEEQKQTLGRADDARRGGLVPGLLGAGLGQRPRQPADGRRRGRRRLPDQRAEDLDQHRRRLGHVLHPGSNGTGRQEARRHLLRADGR